MSHTRSAEASGGHRIYVRWDGARFVVRVCREKVQVIGDIEVTPADVLRLMRGGSHGPLNHQERLIEIRVPEGFVSARWWELMDALRGARGADPWI